MKQFLLVGVGGFIGSILRYGIGLWMTKPSSNFPYGTLTVNLIGSLLIGLLVGLSIKTNQQAYLLVVVGFCGGFTTFSTFSMDAIQLIRSDLWSQAIAYLSVSFGAGVLLCILGFWLGKGLIN